MVCGAVEKENSENSLQENHLDGKESLVAAALYSYAGRDW
jgi:hypothetical protein